MFQIPKPDRVKLDIYDRYGRDIVNLVNDRLKSGTHTVTFDNANLSPGVYFYRLETSNISLTRKMYVIR